MANMIERLMVSTDKDGNEVVVDTIQVLRKDKLINFPREKWLERSPHGPSAEEMHAVLKHWASTNLDTQGEVLDALFRARSEQECPANVSYPRDQHHQIIWTPPYESRTQPIEMVWCHGKGYVARSHTGNTGMRALLASIRKGFYGDPGRTPPHRPAPIAKYIHKMHKHLNKFAAGDSILKGIFPNLYSTGDMIVDVEPWEYVEGDDENDLLHGDGLEFDLQENEGDDENEDEESDTDMDSDKENAGAEDTITKDMEAFVDAAAAHTLANIRKTILPALGRAADGDEKSEHDQDPAQAGVTPPRPQDVLAAIPRPTGRHSNRKTGSLATEGRQRARSAEQN